VSAPYDADDWRSVAHYILTADECHGLVTRGGEQDACGKPPVTIIDAREYDGDFWPACAYHANRYGGPRCVSLAVMLAALREVAA
jgi:hypothetical protein